MQISIVRVMLRGRKKMILSYKLIFYYVKIIFQRFLALELIVVSKKSKMLKMTIISAS